jgi:hypothetical protein
MVPGGPRSPRAWLAGGESQQPDDQRAITDFASALTRRSTFLGALVGDLITAEAPVRYAPLEQRPEA